MMALKCRGPGSPLNFGLEEYEELLPMLPNLSKVHTSQCCRHHMVGQSSMSSARLSTDTALITICM